MKSWQKLIDIHISRRNYSKTYSDLYVDEQPDAPPLYELFKNYTDPIKADNNEGWGVIEAPGIREAARAELFFLMKKTSEALSSTNLLLKNGKSKWASVDAYHAALLSMRVILGQLGIFLTNSNNRFHFLIDIYPNCADSRLRREYFDASKAFSSPCKFITRNEPTIGHKTIIDIFRRAFSVNYNDITKDKGVEKSLRQVDSEKYHPIRNRIIYIGSYIPDIDLPQLPEPGIRDWLESEARDFSLLSNLCRCAAISGII